MLFSEIFFKFLHIKSIHPSEHILLYDDNIWQSATQYISQIKLKLSDFTLVAAATLVLSQRTWH